MMVRSPCSEEAKSLIARMLTTRVAGRISTEEALDHAWFAMETLPSLARDGSVVGYTVQNALLHFTKSCTFRSLMSCVFSHSVEPEERAAVKQSFAQIDLDGDGEISRIEFAAAMDDTGYTSEELYAMFDSVDVDCNGRLSETELMAAFAYQKMSVSDARLEEMFEKMDRNGDGYITRAELMESVNDVMLSDEELRRRRLRVADVSVVEDMPLLKHGLAVESGMVWMARGKSVPAPGSMSREVSSEEAQHESCRDEGDHCEEKHLTVGDIMRAAMDFADLDGDGRLNKQEFMASLHPDMHQFAVVPLAKRVSHAKLGETPGFLVLTSADCKTGDESEESESGLDERDLFGESSSD